MADGFGLFKVTAIVLTLGVNWVPESWMVGVTSWTSLGLKSPFRTGLSLRVAVSEPVGLAKVLMLSL